MDGQDPQNGKPLDSEYLTALEAVTVLSGKVSVRTLSRWAAADPSFPKLKIGHTVRYPRERLLAWLKSKEQGAVGKPRLSRKPMLSAVSAMTEPLEIPDFRAVSRG